MSGLQTDVCSAAAHLGTEYIGCMKIRNILDPRFADPQDRWYDPHNLIFVGDDSRYAEGPFYAVAGHVISGILRSGLVPRMGGPEGERPSSHVLAVCMLATTCCRALSCAHRHAWTGNVHVMHACMQVRCHWHATRSTCLGSGLYVLSPNVGACCCCLQIPWLGP